MKHEDLAERLTETLDALDLLDRERADWMAAWKQRRAILEADLASFREDVRQMRLDEQEQA